MRFAIGLFIALFIPAIGFSDTITVPGPYGSSIQAAINNASEGDLIQVSAGTYIENIDFLGKAIVVRSVSGSDSTVIDGSQSGSVVKMVNGEGSHAILDGFTLTNGTGTYDADIDAHCGGGVFCKDSKPLILNNFIIENEYTGGTSVGGGISCFGAYPLIRNNVIMANAADYGAGISCLECPDATVRIENNLFLHNWASYLGGGIDGVVAIIDIRSCTFNGNECMEYGAGGAINAEDTTMHICDSIIWENSMISCKEIGLHSEDSISTLDIEYSVVAGGIGGIEVDTDPAPSVLNWLNGMISSNPMWVNPSFLDYCLEQDPCQPGVTNPCVDAGSAPAMNLAMHTGWTRTDNVADTGMVDMGYHYGPVGLPALATDAFMLSETGGTINMALDAGGENKNRKYLMLGSVTGTTPGYPLPGGQAILPLNWDIFTDLVLTYANSALFPGFMGTMDGNGQSTAQMFWPGPTMPSGMVGAKLYFAYCLGWPWEFASNPIMVEITP